MSVVHSSSFHQSLLRRAAHSVGSAMVEWATRTQREQVRRVPRLSPQEVHRRRMVRQEAEERREQAALRVLTFPRQF
ncbi:hypothetical protein BCY76_010215 [Nesterenkonia sp. PF2B19]|nr:hypothetical protein BCY76_010215 [Nesterenkonia sp. PF2B19]